MKLGVGGLGRRMVMEGEEVGGLGGGVGEDDVWGGGWGVVEGEVGGERVGGGLWQSGGGG